MLCIETFVSPLTDTMDIENSTELDGRSTSFGVVQGSFI